MIASDFYQLPESELCLVLGNCSFFDFNLMRHLLQEADLHHVSKLRRCWGSGENSLSVFVAFDNISDIFFFFNKLNEFIDLCKSTDFQSLRDNNFLVNYEISDMLATFSVCAVCWGNTLCFNELEHFLTTSQLQFDYFIEATKNVNRCHNIFL